MRVQAARAFGLQAIPATHDGLPPRWSATGEVPAPGIEPAWAFAHAILGRAPPAVRSRRRVGTAPAVPEGAGPTRPIRLGRRHELAWRRTWNKLVWAVVSVTV